MRESNPRTKLCRLLPNHSANAPELESKMGSFSGLPIKIGAGKEVRTPDLYLGKVSLYQLSYSRITGRQFNKQSPREHYFNLREALPKLNRPCHSVAVRPFAGNRTLTIGLKKQQPKSTRFRPEHNLANQKECH